MIFNYRILTIQWLRQSAYELSELHVRRWMVIKSVWPTTVQLMCLCMLCPSSPLPPMTVESDFEYCKQIICVHWMVLYCIVLCSFHNRAKMPIWMLPKKACNRLNRQRMMYAYWIYSMLLRENVDRALSGSMLIHHNNDGEDDESSIQFKSIHSMCLFADVLFAFYFFSSTIHTDYTTELNTLKWFILLALDRRMSFHMR